MRIVEYLFRNKYIDFLVDYWNDYRYNVKMWCCTFQK